MPNDRLKFRNLTRVDVALGQLERLVSPRIDVEVLVVGGRKDVLSNHG